MTSEKLGRRWEDPLSEKCLKWNLDTTASLLASRFSASHILVIRPARSVLYCIITIILCFLSYIHQWPVLHATIFLRSHILNSHLTGKVTRILIKLLLTSIGCILEYGYYISFKIVACNTGH